MVLVGMGGVIHNHFGTGFEMKLLLSLLFSSFAIAPAFAVVEVVPAPSVGVGIPAAVAVIVVAAIVFVRSRRKA